MQGPGWVWLPLPSRSLLPLPLADLLAREAQLLVTIGNVKGVLDTSILDPEPGPQGPFISYSYYVTYDFVEDEEGERSTHGGVLAEVCAPRAAPGNWGTRAALGFTGSPVRQNRFLGPRKPFYSELSGSHSTRKGSGSIQPLSCSLRYLRSPPSFALEIQAKGLSREQHLQPAWLSPTPSLSLVTFSPKADPRVSSNQERQGTP